MAQSRSASSACLVVIIIGILYLAAFAWYANTVIPHTTPTPYTNFFWGLLQGFFVVPTFLYSLFAHGITIYQFPNDGSWYNFGFLLGVTALPAGSSSRRRSS